MINKTKKVISKIIKLNRFEQGCITVASAAACAAVLYSLYPFVIVASALCVLILHEFGHFFTANRVTDAALPIFIPVIFTIVGVTVVIPTDSPEEMVNIYSAGPRWGLFGGAVLLVVGVATSNPAFILSSLSLACCEIYSITLGSDGQRVKGIKQAKT